MIKITKKKSVLVALATFVAGPLESKSTTTAIAVTDLLPDKWGVDHDEL